MYRTFNTYICVALALSAIIALNGCNKSKKKTDNTFESIAALILIQQQQVNRLQDNIAPSVQTQTSITGLTIRGSTDEPSVVFINGIPDGDTSPTNFSVTTPVFEAAVGTATYNFEITATDVALNSSTVALDIVTTK